MFNFHAIEKLVENLLDFSVIVEGKRDRLALERMGFSDIFTISGDSIESFVEKLPRENKYVILTDFDREGEKLNLSLSEIMFKNNFEINNRLRKSVKGCFGVTQIEELIKFSKIMEDVYYGKISTINYKIFNRSKIFRRWSSREARRHWGGFWSN
ncbi:MAG: toprim domain-containing protein [Candidatus Aenigmarchaeota archaeon]|nr:toprim domain-containing protein [Candidatus Aenigmarchaeota archaeon]